MWAMAVVILLVGVVCAGTAYSAYQDEEAENDTQDFYDGYDEDNGDSKELTVLNLLDRMKRFEDNVQIRTLDPKEIHDVQGALGKIFNGHLPESLTARIIRQYTDIYDYIDNSKTIHDHTRRTEIPTTDYEDEPKTLIQTSPDPVQEFSEEYFHYQPAADLERLRPAVDFHGWQSEMGGGQQWAPEMDVRGIPTLAKLNYGPTFEDLEATTSDVQVVEIRDMTPIEDLQPDRSTSTPSPEEQTVGSIEAQTWMPLEDAMPNSILQETSTYSNDYMQAEVNKLMPDLVGTVEDFTSSEASTIDVIDVQKWSAYTETPYIEELSTYNSEEIRKDVQYIMYPYETTSAIPTWMEYPQRVQTWSPSDDANILRSTSHVPIQREEPTTTSSLTTTTTNTTATTIGVTLESPTTSESPTTTESPTTSESPTTVANVTKRSPRMDINAIIAIIANLTYDYEWNLTEEFNRTLIEHGVPTCPTASTLSTTPTTPAPYDFANTSIVGKCFVCGLKTPEIPRDAACADAFSGDFLPLAPIDARSRGQIATFRKYCRHLDVHNYVENPSEPRSIYGRFTGGCGVRWTDLTGVYTQRTCRARFRPMMGKHFASKRMAKLELALINVENGCIISPMASLLPMSRGLSLYARFHACVCTGNWCNPAHLPTLPAVALLVIATWPAPLPSRYPAIPAVALLVIVGAAWSPYQSEGRNTLTVVA